MLITRHLIALAFAALVVGTLPYTALAGPPPSATQAPAFYRTALGSFEITALSNGTIELPIDKLLLNATPAQVRKALDHHHLHTPLATSVNGYLINTGTRLILIDAGAGSLFGPTLGRLSTNLRAAGYEPEQVDEIYITHLHPDHVGGLSVDGQRVFTNAVVRAEQKDVDYWLSSSNRDRAPADSKIFFDGAMASLNPYVDAARLRPFSGDSELAPGIRASVTRGHTIGHSIYEVESDGQRLVIWGDLVHVAALQFAHPEIAITFDSDRKTAVRQRRRAFEAAARSGDMAAAAHVAFPGLGRVRFRHGGYEWIPANYEDIQASKR
ncbi:MBL fold metallo-hydrolase [Variovorax sp. WS11]|uniref:MBL fold metallo-hydrolase n=1 Tax=Variovorax sp. WS11 TaxID=1105204 RepID=UPI000D0DBB7E|nr:MBL fold metallo-hydrolase [Variovorax sp. WS11]NDZ17554.1 MBL fold metallo-hydrolase [Variovorax sp. WS11]PSL82240.1 MBL fold metallo-hydrolase [Variovorax sp. WS11]